jgi:hypothetical protein
MKQTLTYFPFLLLLLPCCAPPEGPDTEQQPPSPVQEEIHTFLQSYYQTMSDRDWEAYRDFFWDKATITTIWQAEGDSTETVFISTIDEFIEKTPEGPDSQPIFEEKMLEADIDVRADLAQAWVTYAARFGTEDNLMEWQGMDLFSLMEHQGAWRIVSLTFSANY